MPPEAASSASRLAATMPPRAAADDDTHSRVAPGSLGEHLANVRPGRRVVDDDMLEIGERLRPDRLETGREVRLFGVVDRRQYRTARRHRPSAPARPAQPAHHPGHRSQRNPLQMELVLAGAV